MIFITARFIDVTIGPHVREEEEATGPDVARHSEKAYA
ncbi:Uncharacterised protein [uncultured archaeon]|nr:Uncharacterised protein [uncultured archaeon]